MPSSNRPFSRCITIISAAAAAMMALSPANFVQAQMQMPACHAMPSNVGVVAPEALPVPQKLTGIGNMHFPISSHNPETQAWFDQGINLIFDYWDYEANRAFEQAIRTDPDCAICHWGLAQSLGIHNSEVEGYAHDEQAKALALRSHADKRERMYIDAAQAEVNPATGKKEARKNGKDGGKDPGETILREIIKKYPSDTTARLMLAEAIGDGYDEQGKPRAGTQERITLIQEVLKEHPDDSAANHLWIHAVEASPHPEQALKSAGDLAKLAPNSGHMTHMPGHIFYRTGDYERAQVSFDLSTAVDEAYMKAQHVAADDDWNYVHNLMYSIANLLEEGRMEQAAVVSAKLPGARGTRAATLYPWSTRDSMTRLNLMLPVALRGSDWARVESLLGQDIPEAKDRPAFPNLQRLKTALTAYARGMRDAQSKKLEEARKDSAELDAELWRTSQQVEEEAAEKKKDAASAKAAAKPENKAAPTDPNLPALMKNLAILSLELRGAILIEDGKIADAKPLFAQARREETELGYREPPAFIRPVAEQEAELLMAAGDMPGAEEAYKQALVDRPKSGFPLYGLAQIAEKSGDAQRAGAAYREFLAAWKNADPGLPQVKHAQEWVADQPKLAGTGEPPVARGK